MLACGVSCAAPCGYVALRGVNSRSCCWDAHVMDCTVTSDHAVSGTFAFMRSTSRVRVNLVHGQVMMPCIDLCMYDDTGVNSAYRRPSLESTCVPTNSSVSTASWVRPAHAQLECEQESMVEQHLHDSFSHRAAAHTVANSNLLSQAVVAVNFIPWIVKSLCKALRTRTNVHLELG